MEWARVWRKEREGMDLRSIYIKQSTKIKGFVKYGDRYKE